MGQNTLCYFLLLAVVAALGSADECKDLYAECPFMAAANDCNDQGQWGEFVRKSCPLSCKIGDCSAVKMYNAGDDDFYVKLLASGNSQCNSVNNGVNPSDDPATYAACKSIESPLDCDAFVPIPRNCKDSCPEACKAALANGQCENKTDTFWRDQCPESCDVPECKCEDLCPVECAKWAGDGDCKRDYVARVCPLSCNPACKCNDTCPEACKKWDNEGLCNKDWVKDHCRKTCDPDCITTTIPPTTPTTPTTTTKDCTDKCIPACGQWGRRGLCSNALIAAECPGTCDPDCSPDPTPDPTTKPGHCDCPESRGQFKIIGDCTHWCHCDHGIGYYKACAKDAILYFDPISRQCREPSMVNRNDCHFPEVEVQARGLKADQYADCKFWAANGDCSANNNCGTCDWQEWVCNHCQTTCGYPSCQPAPPNPNKKDAYADCKFWAANGDCHHSPNCGTCDWQDWVKQKCPYSCQ